MEKKRYGVIIEALINDLWKFLKIEYYNTLEEAKERKNKINNNYTKHRVYGIFDYETITYKYIFAEKEL